MMHLRSIIIRMLDFYRRAWRAFLAAFIGSVGVAAGLIKDYSTGSRVMFIVASIFLIVFLIGLCYDYQDARKKAKQERVNADREALYQSVRRLHPEYTEEQVKWFIDGKLTTQ